MIDPDLAWSETRQGRSQSFRIFRKASGYGSAPVSAMNELQDIANRLSKGESIKPMTVRMFLGLFGQERRGYKVVDRIRKTLKRHKLSTQPDFENENIDTLIHIVPQADTSTPELPDSGGQDEKDAGTIAPVESEGRADTPPREAVVTIRQGIPAAGQAPATVRPNEPVMKAVSRLMSEKLSLLVVQRGDHSRAEGIFNYASFTHAHMAGKTPKVVGDCISHEFIEVNEEKSLVDAVRDIMQHGTVGVRSSHNQLCGVVTARDVAPVFVDLAEPFLLLGQIENHLRGLLERAKLTKDDYKVLVVETDAPRKERTEGPDNLTLGELIAAFDSSRLAIRQGDLHQPYARSA
jgi:CBS-domain-containing membrane protein